MTEYSGKMVLEAKLTSDQLDVIRRGKTEAPYLGSYDKHMPSEGVYVRQHPPNLCSLFPRPR